MEATTISVRMPTIHVARVVEVGHGARVSAPISTTRWRSGAQGPQPEARHQRYRVDRRPDLRVVVEVDDDVVTGLGPAAHPGGPEVQRLVVVPADVELLVAVQPDVRQRRRRL